MTFTAFVTRNSSIWQMWTSHGRIGGELWGVPFHWVEGGEFVTDVLSDEQVLALTGKPDITLEMSAADAPPVDPPIDPPIDPPVDPPVDPPWQPGNGKPPWAGGPGGKPPNGRPPGGKPPEARPAEHRSSSHHRRH